MLEASPQLPITRLRLLFDGPAAPQDSFAGNHWRGALGPALRERACLTGEPECAGCSQRFDCSYAYVFETPTPLDATKMRRYAEVPHPYVLSEAGTWAEGRTGIPDAGVALSVTLFGRAGSERSLVAASLVAAANSTRGIGGRQLKFRGIESAAADSACTGLGTWQPATLRDSAAVSALAAWPAHVPTDGVRIRLLSPLRVKRDGRPVLPDVFGFADLFGVLLRRLSMLTTFHTDTPLSADFRALMAAARVVPTLTSLYWVELQRHSSRQNARMQMGGVMGHLDVLPGVDLAPFWPCLWLGQHTHAGAGTTMGLGRYELMLPAAPAANSVAPK